MESSTSQALISSLTSEGFFPSFQRSSMPDSHRLSIVKLFGWFEGRNGFV